MIILHASDLHFGKPHRPAAAEALLRLAEGLGPDAVVVSGDLTQRAKTGEYRAAADFLGELAPLPVVVTPGNHDVPLYRVWERLLAPYGNYRAYVGGALDTVLDVNGAGSPGARFVAVNSAAPRSAIVNGRLAERQFSFAREAFAAAPPGSLRVLVLHHNLLRPRDGEPVPTLPRASRVLRRAEEWGVDLILSGHIHRSHLGRSRGGRGRAARRRRGGGAGGNGAGGAGGIPVVAAGTSSSDRGRATEAGRNSVNLVRVGESALEVVVHLYCEEAGRFLPGRSRRYPRPTR